MFKLFDICGDGTITTADLGKVISRRGGHKISNKWNNASGHDRLRMEGLRNRNKGSNHTPIFKELVEELHTPISKELVGIIDQDGNGIITFNEFVWFSEK